MPDTPLSGTAAGVPYVALPPAHPAPAAGTAPLVVAWHWQDPPRSAAAMAAALPLDELPAWKVYLDLPMHGERQLPGGLDDFYRLGFEDAVLKVFRPSVIGAAEEFPAALAELREKLPVDDGPVGLLGGSVGAAVAQLVLAEHDVPVAAAALVSPAIQLSEVVAYNERNFDITYQWSAASRAVAARIDFITRAAEIADRDPQPAVLLVNGADDDPTFHDQAERLSAELRNRYARPDHVERVMIPDMGHPLAEQPGIEPAPQIPAAARVDKVVTGWFRRYLR
jgi:pimeloyl-ACP methyl ester carboxylesterase